MAAVVINTALFDAAMADIERVAPRAAMWAMREAGRHVVTAARGYEAPHNRTGALNASIKPSRTITDGGLTVAPRGLPRAYAPKIEAVDPFMAPALASVAGEFHNICEDAMGTALREMGV